MPILIRTTEPHHGFNAGPVVPRPIKENDFSGCREVLKVALEVPLSRLYVRRLGQRHDPSTTRIERFGNTLNHAALARGISAFENNEYPTPKGLNIPLRQGELLLKKRKLLFVVRFNHAGNP